MGLAYCLLPPTWPGEINNRFVYRRTAVLLVLVGSVFSSTTGRVLDGVDNTRGGPIWRKESNGNECSHTVYTVDEMDVTRGGEGGGEC